MAEKNTGAAAIVCPGGAFRHLSLNKEGYEVAEFESIFSILEQAAQRAY